MTMLAAQVHPQRPPSAPEAPSAPPASMQVYRCDAGHFMFASDGTWGRVRVTCRRCKRSHTFYMGGYRSATDRAGEPVASEPPGGAHTADDDR